MTIEVESFKFAKKIHIYAVPWVTRGNISDMEKKYVYDI